MGKGQAITKEEMVEVLKEAFVGFREVTKDDMSKAFVGFREVTKDDMSKAFVGFREVIKKDTADLIKTEVPKLLLEFHDKVQIPMTDEVLSRLDSVEGRIGLMERKLDKVTDHQAEVLDNHAERIGRIEAIV